MNRRDDRWFGAGRLIRLASIVQVALAFPMLAAAGETVPSIPLEVGLTEVSVTHDSGTDYEVFRTVVAADDDTVTFVLRRGAHPADPDSRVISVTRVVARQDLAESNRLIAYFHSEDPQFFPGSTAFQASSALFSALERGDEVPFVFGVAAGLFGQMGARKYYRGDLRRVEPATVPVSVLLNGIRTQLPALHVRGTLKVGDDMGEAEFWWLSQADNAISLRWTFKDSRVQVIRIDTPTALAVSVERLAIDLGSELCRTELHGIYFDTGSAILLPQSETEIAEVAELANGHLNWQLAIEGHTDSLGSDADNLVLSQQRAEAVRSALIKDYGIAATRLGAKGFGEAQPVESNDTLEGRARNRRVELARQCP